MKCPQPLRNDLHRNAAFEAVFYWEKGMLKRLYKRFLEWALAPVLGDLCAGVESARAEASTASMRVGMLETQVSDMSDQVASLSVLTADLGGPRARSAPYMTSHDGVEFVLLNGASRALVAQEAGESYMDLRPVSSGPAQHLVTLP